MPPPPHTENFYMRDHHELVFSRSDKNTWTLQPRGSSETLKTSTRPRKIASNHRRRGNKKQGVVRYPHRPTQLSPSKRAPDPPSPVEPHMIYKVKVRSTMGGSVARSTLKLPILLRLAAAGPTSSSFLLATNMLPFSANMTDEGWYLPSATGIFSRVSAERQWNTKMSKIKRAESRQREREREIDGATRIHIKQTRGYIQYI